MILEDGRGSGIRASVSGVQRLNTSAKTAPRIFYVSRDDERAFSAVSTYSTTSGDFIFYAKNTDTSRNLIIHGLEVGSVNAAVMDLHIVSGTASGTALTAANLNLSSGRAPDGTLFGNAAISGLTAGTKISTKRLLAGTSGFFEGVGQSIVLGFNDAIAIKYTGSTGVTDTVCQFYFEDPTKR